MKLINTYQIMNLILNTNSSTIMTLGLYPNTLNSHMAPTVKKVMNKAVRKWLGCHVI